MYRIIPIGVKRLADGCEIPFVDGNADYEAYELWLAAGNEPLPQESPEVAPAAVAAVQRRLDEFAQTRGYDGILSACTYAASTVPKFAAEGAYCVAARDAHWAICYELLGQVQAGTRLEPTLDEVLGLMPPLEWPE